MRAVRLVTAVAMAAVATVPLRAGAEAGIPDYVAAVDLRQAGTHVRMSVSDARPYGFASINSKKLTIECVKIDGQVGLTTLLIPWVDDGVVAVRGRQKSGQRLWIMILKDPFRKKARMSIKNHPDEDWGWCGTGGAAFFDATKASGYVIIA